MTTPPVRPVETTLFSDALKDWANDDLLIKQAARDRLEERYPGVFRVLDWPQLREAFLAHDALANAGKKESRRIGVLAVLLGGAGACLMALTQFVDTFAPLDGPWKPLLLATFVAMTGVGGLLAIWHLIGLRARDRWLSHRFWTERLRQLNFQILATHIDLVVRAMDSDASLAELQRLRARVLGDILERTETQMAIKAMVEDITEREAWLLKPEPINLTGLDQSHLDQLLEGLRFLRVGVQLNYVGRALSPSLYAPKLRSRVLGVIGDICVVAVIPIGIFCALAFIPSPVGRLSPDAMVALTGAISAVGLTARTLDQGFRGQADAERYEWYFAALRALAGRFDDGQSASRVEALRELEVISYQELRRFIDIHRRARFL